MAALAAAVSGGWAGQHLAADLAEGYVDAAGPVVALGIAAVAVGLLLSVPALRARIGAPAPPRGVPAGIGGRAVAGAISLAVAAALMIVGSTAPRWPVRSTTAGSVSVAAVPQQVSEIGWTRSVPLFYDSLDYSWVAAGPGLVLITDGPDGPMVQGLDGTTGDTVWTYRRVGARILRLDASPDGRTVYVDSTMEGSWSSDFRVQAIDARTGKLRGLTTGGDARYQQPTTAGLLEQYEDRELRSLSPMDMDEQWSWELEPGCSFWDEPRPTLSATMVTTRCSGDYRLAGLDPDTGTEMWSRDAEGLQILYADASGDLLVALQPSADPDLRNTFLTLDAASGETRAEIGSDHGLTVDRGLGCCAGEEESPTSVDARTGQRLGESVRGLPQGADDIAGSWEYGVVAETLVEAAVVPEDGDRSARVEVAVTQFEPGVETVVFGAEIRSGDELGLDAGVKQRVTDIRAGPGAVFILAATFPAEESADRGELTVLGLQ